jgi:hypothetical protein
MRKDFDAKINTTGYGSELGCGSRNESKKLNFLFVSIHSDKIIVILRGSVADPHHVDADPDPAFHFDADPDPDLTFHSDANPDPDPTFKLDPDPTTQFYQDLDPPMLQK